MTDGTVGRRSSRFTFLSLIAWLSVCLLVVGLFPHQVESFGSVFTIAGLFGLVSAVGLSEVIKLELRTNYIKEARTDPLTGVGNRRAFDSELNICEARWRDGGTCSLLLIDVDYFKSFNDRFGHHAGDEMLRSVANVLKHETEGNGFVARYGGEEFAVILPDTDLSEAEIIAESLREFVAIHHVHFRKLDLRVTVRIGVAQAQPNDVPNDLIVRADHRLYAAKEAGRNRICAVEHDQFASANGFADQTCSSRS